MCPTADDDPLGQLRTSQELVDDTIANEQQPYIDNELGSPTPSGLVGESVSTQCASPRSLSNQLAKAACSLSGVRAGIIQLESQMSQAASCAASRSSSRIASQITSQEPSINHSPTPYEISAALMKEQIFLENHDEKRGESPSITACIDEFTSVEPRRILPQNQSQNRIPNSISTNSHSQLIADIVEEFMDEDMQELLEDLECQ